MNNRLRKKTSYPEADILNPQVGEPVWICSFF
ncbi:hypothetical protein EPIR_2078 [Erwinia piriflorinigrans CFBP 5888]|uniref:Uncharacterized protein n=1 Tax=Erwinia piriflorinigrans CFBP 5888 TaxID=1161919 RepID=V5Z917_9GAMM|nr:hypothetical protein EPIR_2078 [Erwinia piriflorinigrans CFBP 5888]